MTDGFVLARLLGDVARKRVLELGCGDGARAVELASAGATVIAVDPDAQGTGLGLYLSKRLVEGVGGSLRVERGPERGTVVTVEFPAA